MKPNRAQQELITNTEGIYLVDAGPGTGKTFALTRRYIHLLERDSISPDDLLLVTFTNNAAREMKHRIISRSSYNSMDLVQAPISTFHSLANDLVSRNGYQAPHTLGIEDNITPAMDLIENNSIEERKFRRFFRTFRSQHSQFQQIYPILRNPGNILHLIKSLAAKGVFPTKDGWYGNGEDYLTGNHSQFARKIEELNQQQISSRGREIQTQLRNNLTNIKHKAFHPDAPSPEELLANKQIPEGFMEQAYLEDRSLLNQFLHDLYLQYIEYCLAQNYLNFSFLLLFGFIILREEPNLPETPSYRYIMIDEFQDTNELQLKLALLLAETNNICVVGDWKQSIYGFQYASVENITKFEQRLNEFKSDLNSASSNSLVNYPVEPVQVIELTKNYRSSQKILDFSENALTSRATKKEKLDTDEIKEKIVTLEAENEPIKQDKTAVEAIVSSTEVDAILHKILQIVNSDEYPLEQSTETCPVRYEDIAVLARTSKFGLKLQRRAQELNIPAEFDGGIDLFTTNPALILLAWLRIVTRKDSQRGWAVVLERAGYNLHEIDHILKEEDYPSTMENYADQLSEVDDIGKISRRVFERYDYRGPIPDKIIEVLHFNSRSSLMTLGETVQFIEDNIESNHSYELQRASTENAVTIKTIHGAKGLEYPVVFLAGINQHHFPSSNRSSGRLFYDELVGLRQKKVYRKDPRPQLYDNWSTAVLNGCLTNDYDEERRLMYVAMTRAENYLVLTGEKGQLSRFFHELPIEPVEITPELRKLPPATVSRKKTPISVDYQNHSPVVLSARDLVDLDFSETRGGKGTEHGIRVHQFAEDYVNSDGDISPRGSDQQHLRQFLDSLNGKLTAEQDCLLPLEYDGRRILIRGTIDLIVESKQRTRIIDFKTDRDRSAYPEYKKQLSVYYHVIQKTQPNSVTPFLFYTEDSTLQAIKPLSRRQLSQLAVKKGTTEG